MHKEPINGKKSLIKTTGETRDGGKCNVQRVRLTAGYKSMYLWNGNCDCNNQMGNPNRFE